MDECEHGEPYGPSFMCPACKKTPRPRWSSAFDAEYEGHCIEGDQIVKGDRIVLRDIGDRRQYAHTDCAVMHP